MTIVEEHGRKLEFGLAVEQAAEKITSETPFLSTAERLSRLDGLLEEIGSAWEGEDDTTDALVQLAAEALAWLVARGIEDR